jgi:hypothetical protein
MMSPHVEELLVKHPEALITYRADKKGKKIWYRGEVIQDLKWLNETPEAKEVWQEIDEQMQELVLRRYLRELKGENPDESYPMAKPPKSAVVDENKESHWSEKRTIDIGRI